MMSVLMLSSMLIRAQDYFFKTTDGTVIKVAVTKQNEKYQFSKVSLGANSEFKTTTFVDLTNLEILDGANVDYSKTNIYFVPLEDVNSRYLLTKAPEATCECRSGGECNWEKYLNTYTCYSSTHSPCKCCAATVIINSFKSTGGFFIID